MTTRRASDNSKALDAFVAAHGIEIVKPVLLTSVTPVERECAIEMVGYMLALTRCASSSPMRSLWRLAISFGLFCSSWVLNSLSGGSGTGR